MTETTRINLHCHTVLSDGELTPEDLAYRLAQGHVKYAALTDHDTIDGLTRFHDALKRYNIGFLAGVELTTYHHERELHLLAYGFDPHHEEFNEKLMVLRQERSARIQGAFHRMPAQYLTELHSEPTSYSITTGKLETKAAIELIHRAGGRAFLAHPLVYENEASELDRLISELKEGGLDGLEVTWTSEPEPGQKLLHDLVLQHNLLRSSGTDLHSINGVENAMLGVEMPTKDWKSLVRAITSQQDFAGLIPKKSPPLQKKFERDDLSWARTFMPPGIVLPSLIAIVLFGAAIWGVVLPSIEKLLIDRKRDMIRELTNTAMSLLTAAQEEEQNGKLTRKEAQQKAIAYVGALRYGKEGKDYFWIQDMQPRMIMHPYRSDLNGKDLSQVRDPRGIRIFEQFVKIVKRQQMGFVAYVWQWKDDPERLAAKESYIMAFEPWRWIIGTGMYIDDVKAEIKSIEQDLVYTLSGIAVLVLLVLVFNIRQYLNVERKRGDVENSLKEAEQRYRSLIEATTEGTLLVLDGRCRYGNPMMVQITGYRAEILELLELSDLFPKSTDNEALWEQLDNWSVYEKAPKNVKASLLRADGQKKECLLTLNPIVFAGHPGIIILAKDV